MYVCAFEYISGKNIHHEKPSMNSALSSRTNKEIKVTLPACITLIVHVHLVDNTNGADNTHVYMSF